MKQIIIGSRGSDLALYQANKVKDLLLELGVLARIEIIRTKGDNIQHLSFDKIEGKGFFTKEIEEALLSKQIDIAVHSCKDLETCDPEGLEIAAIFDRSHVQDAILFKKEAFAALSSNKLKNPCFGTSSARRKSQLLRLYPGAQFKDIRGNVPTRISKLQNDADLDAIVLAQAGFTRLNIDVSYLHVVLPKVDEFVPAAAQGALAIQCRNTDEEIKSIVQNINDPDTYHIVGAERRLLAMFGGGCQKPTAIHIVKNQNDGFNVYISHSLSGNQMGAKHVDEVKILTEKALLELCRKVKKKESFLA